MAIIDLSEAPSRSMQRWFGLSLAALIAIVGLSFSRFSETVGWILGAIAIGEGAVYYLVPRAQLSIIRGWQIITFPIAWTVGHILLGIVFWLVVLPLGLVLRMLKYDPLRLRKEDATSNWQDRTAARPSDSYFKQF
ncbi:MAG: SxtJ family membrane protein [Aureliella sp.]